MSLKATIDKILDKISSKLIKNNFDLGYATKIINSQLTYYVYAGKKSRKKITEKLNEDYEGINYNMEEKEDSDLLT